ncbi:transposase tan1 [Rutstroemia sp. NJR-2017a BBW]|nr:transposase tan1 [Rutstroemia sp. NJR-2017a BBW]
MDRASQVLAQGVPPGVPRSYRALADHGNVPHSTLHHRARGRPSMEEKARGQQYLKPYEEDVVVKYLLHMSDLGQPIRMKFIPFIAFRVTHHRPTTDRPLKPPGRNWTKALEKRHPELTARRVKALDWNRHEKNTYGKIIHWFEVIKDVLQDPAVLAENVYNMDETGVMLSMPGSVKVLVSKHDMRDYRGARVKRTTVTAIECISGDGRYLNPMIIWPASTHRSNWTMFPTPKWQYACSDSGYTDSKISLEWLKCIFDPETKERANKKPRVLICDGFGTHETLEILEFCFENNILLCRLPSHTSHKLQPCDVAVFAPLKAAYRDQVDRFEQGGVNTIAFTPKNIKAGFAASGLFPFNPDRVLRSMPAPPAEPVMPRADEVKVGSCQQDIEPQTPVTPVSAETFMSLQNLIIQQDAHALDETSKQNLARHLQKCTKAFQTSSAKSILQEDRIQFLTTINNEAKVRRSTRSLVLGKAKVMSYEDLEEARLKRVVRESTQVAKGKEKHGRKRKSGTPEADEGDADSVRRSGKRKSAAQDPPESGNKVARAPVTASVVQISGIPIAEDGIVPELWRAPVARMY